MLKEELLKIEEECSFSSFKQEYGLLIGEELVKWAKENYKYKMGIRIQYDGLLLFQYLMPMKNEDLWLKRKERMVYESGHCSYYSFLNHEVPHDNTDPDYIIMGGGFPIIVNGEIHGTICVSGLKHEDDHQVIVDAIRRLKEKHVF